MNDSSAMADFDFDRWVALARDDPEAFERARTQALADVIARAPERLQPRLSGLQWRLDQERRLSGSPMAACLRMYSGMWDSVTGPDGLLAHLNGLTGVGQPAATASVLPFRAPATEPAPGEAPLPPPTAGG